MRHLLFLITCFAAAAVHADQQDYPFKLITRTGAGRQIVSAQNNGPAPVLLNLKLTPTNAIVDPASPIEVVVKAAETAPLATIRSQTPGQGYRVGRNYKFSIGDPDAVPAPDATYRLPFPAGQPITVGQMPGGKITTHTCHQRM